MYGLQQSFENRAYGRGLRVAYLGCWRGPCSELPYQMCGLPPGLDVGYLVIVVPWCGAGQSELW